MSIYKLVVDGVAVVNPKRRAHTLRGPARLQHCRRPRRRPSALRHVEGAARHRDAPCPPSRSCGARSCSSHCCGEATAPTRHLAVAAGRGGSCLDRREGGWRALQDSNLRPPGS